MLGTFADLLHAASYSLLMLGAPSASTLPQYCACTRIRPLREPYLFIPFHGILTELWIRASCWWAIVDGPKDWAYDTRLDEQSPVLCFLTPTWERFSLPEIVTLGQCKLQVDCSHFSPPSPSYTVQETRRNSTLFVSPNPGCSELHVLINSHFVSTGFLPLLNKMEKKEKEEVWIPITGVSNPPGQWWHFNDFAQWFPAYHTNNRNSNNVWEIY